MNEIDDTYTIFQILSETYILVIAVMLGNNSFPFV
jgi:hypothetical protein